MQFLKTSKAFRFLVLLRTTKTTFHDFWTHKRKLLLNTSLALSEVLAIFDTILDPNQNIWTFNELFPIFFLLTIQKKVLIDKPNIGFFQTLLFKCNNQIMATFFMVSRNFLVLWFEKWWILYWCKKFPQGSKKTKFSWLPHDSIFRQKKEESWIFDNHKQAFFAFMSNFLMGHESPGDTCHFL